jgi:hypothetical protein
VLLDHNVPFPLLEFLIQFEVATAAAMGWAEVSNGHLLRVAGDAGFEVLITADKNLSYQQNLSGRKLALIVLSTNNWRIVEKMAPAIIEAIETSPPAASATLNLRVEDCVWCAIVLWTTASMMRRL